VERRVACCILPVPVCGVCAASAVAVANISHLIRAKMETQQQRRRVSSVIAVAAVGWGCLGGGQPAVEGDPPESRWRRQME